MGHLHSPTFSGGISHMGLGLGAWDTPTYCPLHSSLSPAPSGVRAHGGYSNGPYADSFPLSCHFQQGGGGLERSGVGPPLSPSRACLHKAFIAFSVHCVFDIAIVHRLSVLPPPLPDLGKRLGAAGSGHYRRVTPWVYSELGRGFFPCPVLACGAQGGLAVGGLTWPHCLAQRHRGWAGGAGGGSLLPN